MKNNNLRILLIFLSLGLLLLSTSCLITIRRSTSRSGGERNSHTVQQKDPQQAAPAEPAREERPEGRVQLETVPLAETEYAAGEKTEAEAVAVIAYERARQKTPGGKVLSASIAMVNEKKIVAGACWDFVNAVYERAGFPLKKRITLHHQPETGPFADPGLLRSGDWVMYRNLPYGEIGHSAIFVEWIDFPKRSALTIEYVGGNRKEPGQYREADLTKIFGIVRGLE
jgi:hypothetical protein